MSFSVDDLVSSLSSSHIGQEATDLAALQAQLAESLFAGPSSSMHPSNPFGRQVAQRGRPQQPQPCNTPLARTPSSSFSMGPDAQMSHRRRGSHSYSHRRSESSSMSYSSTSAFDDTEEDERMVEELLMPSSPTMSSASASTPSHHAFSHSHPQYQHQQPHSPSYISPAQTHPSYSSPTSYDPAQSLFTSTDPFYLAQLQASQQAFQPSLAQQQGVFAQNGRMAQGSPFALYGHPQAMQVQYQAQTAF